MDDFTANLENDNGQLAETVINHRMVEARRTNAQRDALKIEISHLLLRGTRLSVIAAKTEIPYNTVRDYIKTIEAEWHAELMDSMDKIQAREITKIDEVEREAWESWERSKTGRTKDQVNSEIKTEGGAAKRTPRVSRTTKESSVGDPRFLDIVFRCVEKRIAIYGIDKVRNAAIQDTGLIDNDDPITARLSKYRRVIIESTVEVDHIYSRRDSDLNDSDESVDSERPPRQTGRILDAVGSVKE